MYTTNNPIKSQSSGCTNENKTWFEQKKVFQKSRFSEIALTSVGMVGSLYLKNLDHGNQKIF